MNKTKHLVIKVTQEFKDKVCKVASSDNKSMSAYVTECILVDLKKRGLKNAKSAND